MQSIWLKSNDAPTIKDSNESFVWIPGSINIFFVLCNESYPNTIRNFGYGLNIGTGKVGALILSFVSELISTTQINILFSTACFIIFICTFFIEETYGKTLSTEIPELLEENDKL